MKKSLVILLIVACSVMIVGCEFQQIKASGSETIATSADHSPEEVSAEISGTKETTVSASEESFGQMVIEDVFIIQEHGVIITGIINHGMININDVISVNGEKYTVFMIDAVDPDTGDPYNVDSVEEGMSVALHLATMDAGEIKQGDTIVVESKSTAE